MALLVVYIVIVSAPIWTLLGAYALGGDRSDRFAAEARGWIIANAHPVAFVVSLGFGLLFTLQGVAELLT